MDRKYLNIYNSIVSKIENKEYQCNDKLPSEKELMVEFNVSRDTIRKSLNMLEQNGYIQKTKGKGSFVLDINKFDFPVSGVVSFKEIASKLGRDVETKVEVLEHKRPKKSISKKLEINEDEMIWKIVRTRAIDKEKVILDKDYIVEKLKAKHII